MAEVQWWYARDDEQLGPLSPGELRRLAASGGSGSEPIWCGARGWANGLPPRASRVCFRNRANRPTNRRAPRARQRRRKPRRDHSRRLARRPIRARVRIPSLSFRPNLRRAEMFAGELPSVTPSRPTAIESGLFRTVGGAGRRDVVSARGGRGAAPQPLAHSAGSVFGAGRALGNVRAGGAVGRIAVQRVATARHFADRRSRFGDRAGNVFSSAPTWWRRQAKRSRSWCCRSSSDAATNRPRAARPAEGRPRLALPPLTARQSARAICPPTLSRP